MLEHYFLLKMLHIFGAMLFIGNVFVTAMWKMLADRTKDRKIIFFAQRLLHFTDFTFSSVGVFILLLTGLFMSQAHGDDIWAIPWIASGLKLLIASISLWIVILLPLQTYQLMLLREGHEDDPIPSKYWVLERIWIFFGILVVLLPLTNLYFMVYKPT